MSVVYVLLPVASLLAVFFVVAFIWAVRRGQFDDLATPAVRILHDDEEVRPTSPESVVNEPVVDEPVVNQTLPEPQSKNRVPPVAKEARHPERS